MTEEEIEQLRSKVRRMEYAERVTRILCRRSGAVDGFRWGASRQASGWHRSPPLPFHSFAHRGGGTCRVCGQPIYGGGSFRSFAGERSKRLTWHALCTQTYFLWTKPADYAAALIVRQRQRCPASGDDLALPYRDVEVDHDVPLFRVAREHADEPWHELIRFWGFGNLRAITRAAHLAKCAAEARERAGARSTAIEQGALL